MQDARDKEFETVLVYRQDRFFRNLSLLLNTLDELNNLGISFKSVTEPFDTSTPTGRAMLASFGTMAQWERESKLASRNDGMIKAMRAGKYLSGTPPFGYDFDRVTQKLEINDEESSIIRMLFSWLVDERLSEYKIQKKINTMKIPTKFDRLGRADLKRTKSTCWWNRGTIGRIFRNQIYCGIFDYRKYKDPNRTRNGYNLRPKEDWITVEMPDLAIISKETFEKAQKQLKKNLELSPRKTKQVYVFRTKITCGLDGRRFQGATRPADKSRHVLNECKYYFCSGNYSSFTPNKCPAQSVSESRLLPSVWESLKKLLAAPEIVMKQLEGYRNQKNKAILIQKQLKDLEQSLIANKTKRERYAELYAEDSIERHFYDSKIKECEKEEDSLLKEKAKLNQFLIVEEEKRKRIKSIKELYVTLKEGLEDATYELKVEIVQKLVENIIIRGDELEIEFKLPVGRTTSESTPTFYIHSPRMD